MVFPCYFVCVVAVFCCIITRLQVTADCTYIAFWHRHIDVATNVCTRVLGANTISMLARRRQDNHNRFHAFFVLQIHYTLWKNKHQSKYFQYILCFFNNNMHILLLIIILVIIYY